MLSPTHRSSQLGQLARNTFDLVVVGAGIHGAAAARAAALRGYSVALVEQDDLGSGASSRSSRLIHGGLRYLEQRQLGLVFESLAERAILARVARHLVRPLQFVFPVYRGDRVSLSRARLGVGLYDALDLYRDHGHHRALPPAAVTAAVAGLRQGGLQGAVGYVDYRTDDGRLVLENITDAAEQGAVVVTRAAVKGIETRDKVETVRVHDRLGGQQIEVRGRAVLCAVGPWTDTLLGRCQQGVRRWLRPTKGAHIVVPRDRLALDSAVVLQHPADGRVLFAMPYHERTVFGATDTDFQGDPGAASATARDVRYLLRAATHYFPSAHLTADDVIATWAGVRPLLAASADDPSAVSRRERIEVLPGRVVAVAGGRLTTYRRVAAACIDAVAPLIRAAGGPRPRRPARGEKGPLPGAVGLETEDRLQRLRGEIARRVSDDVAVARQLCHAYGVRARALVELVERRPKLGDRVVPGLPVIWAQVVYAARAELAFSLSDVLVRRTQLALRDRHRGLGVVEQCAKLMAAELGWDDAERERQIQGYCDEMALAELPGRSGGRHLHAL